MAPPLLLTLGPEEAISEEKEKGEWKQIKEETGYVSKGEPTRMFLMMPNKKSASILRENPLLRKTKESFLTQGCAILSVGGSEEHN